MDKIQFGSNNSGSSANQKRNREYQPKNKTAFDTGNNRCNQKLEMKKDYHFQVAENSANLFSNQSSCEQTDYSNSNQFTGNQGYGGYGNN
jgi:hypothetical protein